MKAIAAATPGDTVLSAAFHAAGYQTEEERLQGIVATAWKRWPKPDGDQKRYDHIVQCIQREMLTWYLVEKARPGLMRILVLDLQRSKQPASYPGKRNGGGQIVGATQNNGAPTATNPHADYGRRSPGATQGPSSRLGTPPAATIFSGLQEWKNLRPDPRPGVPDSGVEGQWSGVNQSNPALDSAHQRRNEEKIQAKLEIRAALSKFDLFEIGGMLVKFMTRPQLISAQQAEVGLMREHSKRSEEHQKKAAALAQLAKGMKSDTETCEQAWRARKSEAEKIVEEALKVPTNV